MVKQIVTVIIHTYVHIINVTESVTTNHVCKCIKITRFLNPTHGRFLEIAFVCNISMSVCVHACVCCVCVCVFTPEAIKYIHVKFNLRIQPFEQVCYAPINCMPHPPPGNTLGVGRGFVWVFVAPWVGHGGALFLKTGCS